MTDTIAQRYYRSLIGSWSGQFTLEIRDKHALQSLAWRTRLMGFWAAIDGKASMSTTLEEVSPLLFRHTTKVSSMGVPALWSEETISLHDDGTSFVIEGTQHMPTWHEPYRGDGVISADARKADYPISWLGMPMRQRTEIQPEGLLLTQETSWSFASVLLRR
ncbi:MAG: hypothetical protein U0165_10620 [Polyangiaceae bacterium]